MNDFSITFVYNDISKNTWTDWKMLPIERPVINAPELKYVAINLAGADGELDLSEALTPYPVYENRKGSLKFRLLNDSNKSARAKRDEIMNFLHGKRMKMILTEERSYYYIGRLTVSDFKYKGVRDWSDIVINYNLEPYKYDMIDSVEDWLWDPFNFETGVIRGYKNLVVDDFLKVVVVGSRKPVSAVINVITSDPDFNVVVDLVQYPLVNGRNILPEVIIGEGEKEFNFHGDGTITSQLFI